METVNLACNSTPIAALPSTPPTCRVVLNTPEAAPICGGATALTARLASGENMQPMPSPITTSAGRPRPRR